jgi:hypothetical protein
MRAGIADGSCVRVRVLACEHGEQGGENLFRRAPMNNFDSRTGSGDSKRNPFGLTSGRPKMSSLSAAD